ncbi:uncharacterized protein RHO25_002959 [Cercospora beticola]|nr:hypothetical protein RHO25_002959 [Cercospora beticola]CAK1359586.1 unnamed protein product [Cercospora beticola]
MTATREVTIQRGRQLPSTQNKEGKACFSFKIDSYTDETLRTSISMNAYFILRGVIPDLHPWKDNESMEDASPHLNLNSGCM